MKKECDVIPQVVLMMDMEVKSISQALEIESFQPDREKHSIH